MSNIPYREKAYSYQVTVPPTEYPVSLDDLKCFMKIVNPAEDELLKGLLEAATRIGESYSNRIFIDTTFTVLRDGFPFREIELRRCPLKSVESVGYIDSDGAIASVPATDYYHTVDHNGYGSVICYTDSVWPNNLTTRQTKQNVTVIFIAGMAENASGVPSDIQTAIKAHVLALYENRGDCLCSDSEAASMLPPQSQQIYARYKIHQMRVGF